jgi:hypothetical protein
LFDKIVKPILLYGCENWGFLWISLHQYEIILTLISISSGHLRNSPYTIKLAVDTFRRNKSLQNVKWTLWITPNFHTHTIK